MEVITDGYRKATKRLLSVASPVQKLLPQPGKTHNFCLDQAIVVMKRDGYKQEANLVHQHMGELLKGVVWADSAWKNSSHFYNPVNGKGIWGWPNAVMEATAHYEVAVRKARIGNLARCMFFLGATAHLIQDLCVPHHARGLLWDGHQEFEDWASDKCTEFAVDQGGIYQKGDHPVLWIMQNSRLAHSLFPLVAEAIGQDYYTAGKILIPMAQRATAGFFAQFCHLHLF